MAKASNINAGDLVRLRKTVKHHPVLRAGEVYTVVAVVEEKFNFMWHHFAHDHSQNRLVSEVMAEARSRSHGPAIVVTDFTHATAFPFLWNIDQFSKVRKPKQ